MAIEYYVKYYYLEYNSTISCSLMFSGMSVRSGVLMNLPAIWASSHSSHGSLEKLLVVKELTILSSDFDFSRTPIMSPGFSWYDGIFITSPLIVICLCETSCLAAAL